LKIICPQDQCGLILSEQQIQELAKAETYKKYKQFQEAFFISRCSDFKFCPSPDCEESCKGSLKSPKTFCQKCSNSFCFRCEKPWHEGKCNKQEANKFKNCVAEMGAHKCPRCKTMIEKNAGCPHMNCRVCHYDFCWFCGSEYYSGLHKYLPLCTYFIASPKGENSYRFYLAIIFILIFSPLVNLLAAFVVAIYATFIIAESFTNVNFRYIKIKIISYFFCFLFAFIVIAIFFATFAISYAVIYIPAMLIFLWVILRVLFFWFPTN